MFTRAKAGGTRLQAVSGLTIGERRLQCLSCCCHRWKLVHSFPTLSDPELDTTSAGLKTTLGNADAMRPKQ